MTDTVISIENVTKAYQLGVIGTGTFRGDVRRWWAKLRGQPDTHLKIGEKDYGNRDGETVWALNGINFQVQRGEAVGIIGRNGAGKSTLLKILSRVTAPTSGEIKVKGRIASLLEVGTGFHPELTGRQNIFMNGAILGMTRREIQRKFDEIVDFSGVETYIDTPVKRYSSGMYVRLAFAVGAHLDPDILVVDEVLAVGDAEFQKKCLGKMDDVAHQGRTVLFVSHNLDAVASLCPRAILMDKGSLNYADKTSLVVSEYKKSVFGARITPVMKDGVSILKGRGDGEVCFSDIQILDHNKNKTDLIQQGEPFFFDLSFHVFTPVTELKLYIAILDSKSGGLLTAFKHVISGNPLAGGVKGNVLVEIPENVFLPKEYRLYFWLGDSSSKMMTDPFHIIDGENAPNLIIVRDHNPDMIYQDSGIFELPSQAHILHLG